MNNERRKKLSAIAAELIKVMQLCSDLKEQLETLRDEEQDYYDNIPDNMKQTEKAEMSQEAIYAMERVLEAVEAAAEMDPSELEQL